VLYCKLTAQLMPPRVSTHGITLNAAAASKADPMSLLAPCHSNKVLVGVRQANKIRHAYLEQFCSRRWPSLM